MKRLHLLKSMLLLFALIVGTGTMWADEANFTYSDFKGQGASGSGGDLTGATEGNITITGKGNGNASYLQVYANNYLTITPGDGVTITKIVLTASSSSYIKTWSASDKSAVSVSGSTATWSGNSTSPITLTNTASAQARITNIDVTYSTGGSSDPSISLSSSSIEATKEEKSGTINVTYNNIASVDAEILFYESNGSTSATYDHSWISASINGSNNVAYTINENSSYARTAYMKVHQKNTEVYSGLITISQKGAIYTVNIQTPTGGTLVVMNGETPVSDGDAVDDGTTLTITTSASDGYRFRNWQAIDASTHTNTATFTYTINAHDVTIKANFDVEYSVNWSVNGNVISTGIYVNNETIIFPNRPADVLGKKFIGWTATEIAGTQAEVPTLIDYGTKMGTSNVTYYAVFADASGENSTATLTESEIKTNFTATAMAYADNPKTYTDTSDGITWMAKGYSEGTNSKWVQLKKDNVAYFKVSTTSKNIEEIKLTITGNSPNGNDGQNITKNDAFNGTVCLELEAKKTPTGAIASSNVVTNNTVTVSLPVSLNEFYIQTTAGARVWGIELSTNNYTYSNYCTAVTKEPSAPVVVGETVTLTTTANMAGWRSFYDASQDYTLDENTKAYVVTAKSGTANEVELTKLNVTAIPHGAAVILKTTDAGHSMTLTKTTGVATLGTNLLAVTNGTNNVDGYRLGYGTIGGEDAVGFFKYTTTTAPAAGIVYIDKDYVNISSHSRGLSISFADDETTGINAVENANGEFNNAVYYNLSGQRVANPSKGLYIVNGKKVIIK